MMDPDGRTKILDFGMFHYEILFKDEEEKPIRSENFSRIKRHLDMYIFSMSVDRDHKDYETAFLT